MALEGCAEGARGEETRWSHRARPDQGLELTASSACSCLASASGRGSAPAFGILRQVAPSDRAAYGYQRRVRMKTGADHLHSLHDGRQVYLNGQVVDDVVEHPAYRNAVRSVARLYDFQAAPANLDRLTFVSPTSGDRSHRCCQLLRSYVELVQRREALTAWAELTYGFLGPSPAHV